MPSTYTLNNGIELIATGEQSGTWGDTTNVNLGLIDTALDGQVTITLASAGSSGSPNTLAISDGSASNGRNRLVIFADGGDLGATAFVQLTPNDAEKIVYIRNDLSGGRAITLFQGTYNASNDYEVPAGTTAVVFFNGGGAGAVAANVFNNAFFDSLRLGSVSVTAILDEDNMASDSATALATQQSIKAYVDAQVGANNELSEILANGNTSGGNDIQMTTTDEVQFRDAALKISSSVDGQLDIAADVELEIVAPTLDINASTAVTIDTTTLTMTGSVNVVGDLDVDNLNINGNSIISTDTNGNITLDPNGTGVVAVTGPATISGNLAVDTDTLFVDAANNRVGVGTTSPSSAVHAISSASPQLSIGESGSSQRIQIGYSTSPIASTVGSKIEADGVSLNYFVRDAFSGSHIFYTGLSSAERMRIDGSGTLIHKLAATFNEDGADADFRVESDSNANMLFVDAGANAVGINNSTPTALLHLGMSGSANITNNTQTKVTDFTAANKFGTTGLPNNNEGVYFGMGAGNGIPAGLGFMREAVGWNTQIRFYTNNITSGPDGTAAMQEKMRIESSAIVINENSYDQDFRVESDTNTHAIFVDAGANRVGFFDTSELLSTVEMVTGDGTFGDSGNLLSIKAAAGNLVDKLNIGVSSTSGYGFIQATKPGTNVRPLLIQPSGGGTIFNETGVDADFRVESDSNANMLVVDAGANKVLIGHSTNSVAGDLVFNANATRDDVDQPTGAKINMFSGNSNHLIGMESGGMYFTTDQQTRFFYKSGATYQTLFTTASTEVVANDGSNDIDFRVESDADTHALFVEGSSGNVGIGTSSFAYSTAGRGLIGLNGSSSSLIEFQSGGTARGFIISDTNGVKVASAGATALQFETNSAERARIDASGNLLVGTTTVLSFGKTNVLFDGQTQIGLSMQTTFGSVGSDFIRFLDSSGTKIGEIEQNGASTVSYTTSSDYRLKEDVQPMVGSVDRLMALKPVNFAWKVDGSRVDGFIAHETQEIVPEAVTGEKDAVDKDGKPEYQGIDQSKLVPLLTAALQEALQKIETLEARIAALETQ
jgi:hypothetical protein